ncbi:MAG: calcineurin [Spirochaetes bacterium]|nr:calcineurin [Spirochaetota bacterium]
MLRRKADEILALAAELGNTRDLQSAVIFGRRVRDAAEQLAALPPGIRPRGDNGLPGGIVDCDPGLPALVLPDVHARTILLCSALRFSPPGLRLTIAEALEAGKASLIVLGDVLHSESGDAPRRWALAFREYSGAFATRKAMDAEMSAALRAVRLILELLVAFPGRFFYLKGNHDNAANLDSGGDMQFGKFAWEGAMTAAWFQLYGGPGLLADLVAYERLLPLVVRGAAFCASHAEPAFALSPDDLASYRSRPEVVKALIWTDNGEAEPGSVQRSLESLLRIPAGNAVWISGHRPVAGRYALRQEGRLVQIHNPSRLQGAWMRPGVAFDPERDVLDLALR